MDSVRNNLERAVYDAVGTRIVSTGIAGYRRYIVLPTNIAVHAAITFPTIGFGEIEQGNQT